MDITKLSRGERTLVVAGVLLIVDLLFLPWHQVTRFPDPGLRRTALQSPNAVWGVLALMVTAAVVAQVLATRLGRAELPQPSMPWGQVLLIAGASVLVMLLVKLFSETAVLGPGAWLGVLLAGALAYGGYLRSQEPETESRPAVGEEREAGRGEPLPPP